MVEEVNIVMTTLNSLLREWDFFITWICSRRNLTKFNKLWEECIQEEGRIASKNEKLNDNEDQALEAHAKNEINKRKDRGSPPRRSQELKRGKKPRKDYSYFKCYTCHKLGHIPRHCPINKDKFKKKNRKFHSHAVEEDGSDEEKARENEESTE